MQCPISFFYLIPRGIMVPHTISHYWEYDGWVYLASVNARMIYQANRSGVGRVSTAAADLVPKQVAFEALVRRLK